MGKVTGVCGKNVPFEFFLKIKHLFQIIAGSENDGKSIFFL